LNQPYVLRKSSGLIPCPVDQCGDLFDPIELYAKFSESLKKRWKTFLLEIIFEENKDIRTLSHRIRDQLTLFCPCCHITVDPTPDACSAIMCLLCSNYYCNYCFIGFQTGDAFDDRAQSHIHVSSHNIQQHENDNNSSYSDPFLPPELVTKGQLQVRRERLIAFLNK
jgi:hypothetical protein